MIANIAIISEAGMLNHAQRRVNRDVTSPPAQGAGSAPWGRPGRAGLRCVVALPLSIC